MNNGWSLNICTTIDPLLTRRIRSKNPHDHDHRDSVAATPLGVTGSRLTEARDDLFLPKRFIIRQGTAETRLQ